jgi:hypothetical protein
MVWNQKGHQYRASYGAHGYAHALFAVAGTPVIAVSICHGYESQGWTMPAEAKAALIKLEHFLIGPPYGDEKGDKPYVQKEETKTPEAPS